MRTHIPSPHIPIVDKEGRMRREWYSFFAGEERDLEAGEVQAGDGLDGGGHVQDGVALSVAENGITDAMLRQSAGTSVIGRYANSEGNATDIRATGNDRVLQRVDDQLAFGLVKAKAYAVADAPDASDYPEGTIIRVTDEVGGPTLAVSDETNWLRVSDGAVIS